MLDIFLHVPKACGTTFRVYLWQYIKPEHRIAIGDKIPQEMAALVKERKDIVPNLKMLFGHICHGWGDELETPHRYYTILRNPVERVFSLYLYLARVKNGYIYKEVHGMSFGEFLLSGVTSTIDNAIVRQLCGLDRFRREPYHDMKIPYGEITEEHYLLARKNLYKCHGVGVAEKYKQFQDAFGREHRFAIFKEQHLNHAPLGSPKVSRLSREYAHLVKWDWQPRR
jgi:hypothetical protein